MGLKNYFGKRRQKKLEELRKKMLKDKEQEESKPKCGNCGRHFFQEKFGSDNYIHSRGFCNENCLTDYLLKSVKVIRQHMMMMDRGIVSLDIRLKKIVNYLIKQRRQK